MCCVKQLAIKIKLFIHVDIVVLVSEFVVVAILSEWWSVLTTANHCGHIPAIEFVFNLVACETFEEFSKLT